MVIHQPSLMCKECQGDVGCLSCACGEGIGVSRLLSLLGLNCHGGGTGGLSCILVGVVVLPVVAAGSLNPAAEATPWMRQCDVAVLLERPSSEGWDSSVSCREEQHMGFKLEQHVTQLVDPRGVFCGRGHSESHVCHWHKQGVCKGVLQPQQAVDQNPVFKGGAAVSGCCGVRLESTQPGWQPRRQPRLQLRRPCRNVSLPVAC